MRLFDLIQQQDCVRILGNCLGQQSPLIKSHITGRSTDETGHGVALHVFRHVKTHKLDSHGHRQLTSNFGLAHTGWP